MTRFRRLPPVVAVALGAFIVTPALVAATTVPPDSSEPESTVPTSSDPADGASGARRRWLEFADSADPETFAGGAATRELVEGRRVLMIGDSIMASTSRRYGGEMCKELVPRGWEVEVAAEAGRFVDFGDRVLDARLESDWDAAVVMLGNNYGADKAVFGEYLEDIVDRLAPRPTVLVTVTEFEAIQADVNDVIYDIAADFDNVRVVDWAGETAADPALLGGDGLHLSNPGRVAYADMVGAALGRAPGTGEGDCLGSNFTDDSAIAPPPTQAAAPPTTRATTQGGGGGGGGGGGATTQPAPPPTTVAATQPATTAAPPPPPPDPPPPPPPTTAAPTTVPAPGG